MLATYTEFALSLVDAVTPIIKQHFGGRYGVDTKGDGSPVTIADRESERVMRELIQKRFPDHGILGEEMGASGIDSEYVWVLDPIDGTRSFIAGGFDFGTLIGLLHKGRPILGVIAQPVLGHVVVGDNQKCTFNGEAVRVCSGKKLSEVVCLVTDVISASKYQSAEGFQRLISSAGMVRTWGNCFGYTLVARGLASAMIDPIMAPWDLLPLIPVIRGAGGVITDYQGKDPVGAKSIVAASPDLHAELIGILNSTTS